MSEYISPKALRTQVKECFKNNPFSIAVELTRNDCEALSKVYSRARINRMCVETSKYYGKYDL